MLLLTIVFEKDYQDIVDELRQMKEYFDEKDTFIGISESLELDTHFIKIFCSDKDYSTKLVNKFNLYISNIIYKIVIKEFCYDEIYHYLVDTYFFLRYDELKEISNRTLEILRNEEVINDEDMVYCLNKKNAIINKIKACVEENKEINIKGFITFRLKELKGELEAVIDRVVEKFMAEKEYNEFIKLLKYFVEVQESKIDLINIVITSDGNYIIKDREGKDIMDQLLSDLSDARYSDSITVEDLIISGLITYCPERIIIHNRKNSKNKEVIDTITKVFEERVEFCHDCKMCKKVKNIVKA
ncbi:YtxC-like family protein [Clostridium homopropionicum DSM 5847]|uniref:YtxC-like family protein n=1 Tax=Clostridium homopropionicum DSM 5847 TaxID=1121318 RepID=A0A0L6ZB86_9CLOT|nr:putative sporulation protein YtxC [Clostridium homopropionicum]KOA20226.1 YtxC-like family protein [Clostridium homopropionicum DSM 5847]SFG58413.1 putative sporulation protein YtxC [Clostridium homopropionicum]